MKYATYIEWSNEDDAFIAFVPELPGCIAHGDTREEALKEVLEAAEDWLQAAPGLGMHVEGHLTREAREAAIENGQDLAEKKVEQLRAFLAAQAAAQAQPGAFIGVGRSALFDISSPSLETRRRELA